MAQGCYLNPQVISMTIRVSEGCFDQPSLPAIFPANKAGRKRAHSSPEVAIIDGNAHVDVAIGILQDLYLNLILLGLELDLISSHVG
jgi:hypothetical protein